MRVMRKKSKQPEATAEKVRRWGNHPFVIPVVTFLVLFFVVQILFINAGGTTVGATDTRVVKLTVDNKTQVIPTRAQTVGDLLKRLDITLQKDDIVSPAA